MIPASELRIGNLVLRDGKIVRCFNPYDSFEPIPLSERLILKLNFFRYDSYFMSWVSNDDFKISVSRNRDTKKFSLILQIGNAGYPIAEIDYVHQLQNGVFFLLGKELTVLGWEKINC